MSKSNYADQLNQGKWLIDKIHDGQIGRLSRAEYKDQLETLNDWESLAGAEASVKERYQGRYLFELVQNANDAIIEFYEESGKWPENREIRIELREHSLLVANSGQPFAEDNIQSLCRLHKSTKTHKQIGHKGIGFKSVLEICDIPEIYSDIYAFGYDGFQFKQDVENVMRVVCDRKLPTLKAPYPRYINQLPEDERVRIEQLFDDLFVTVVRLPLMQPETSAQVAACMLLDIAPTLLLFMSAVETIVLQFPDGQEIAYWRTLHQQSDPKLNIVTLNKDDVEGTNLHSRWLILGPIEKPIIDRSLVKQLKEDAWNDVTALRFSFVIPLNDKSKEPLFHQQSHPFHVYFPTQEYSGLKFIVHGDFYVGDDRKTIPLNLLNRWLIDEICTYLADNGIELLKLFWPHSLTLLDILAPLNLPEREFARHFIDVYLHALSMAPFVPIDGGHYKTPDEIRFPPPYANDEEFRKIFPASHLRGQEKWAYPIPAVAAAEEDRKIKFLLAPEMGAQQLSPQYIFQKMMERGLPPIEKAVDLLAFLADWYEKLPRIKYPQDYRHEFIELLKELPIFPTMEGWAKPGNARVFHASLRPNAQPIEVPAGFELSIIRRDFYPLTNASNSNQYKLFNDLGARDYAFRDIVRDVILPRLIDETRFNALMHENQDSVVKAYRLLKSYHEEAGTTTEFADRLRLVLVPTTNCQSEKRVVWKPTNDCYFGRSWPGGDVLEQVYGQFKDCYFLDSIPGLDMSDEGLEKDNWAAFFRWLGVMNRPRMLSSTNSNYISYDNRNRQPQGLRSARWVDYIGEFQKNFKCLNNLYNHGFSRRLCMGAYEIHHFSDLVDEGDHSKLYALFSLLSQHWVYYKNYTKADFKCARNQKCPSQQIPSYLLYELRKSPWLPAQIGEHVTEPLSPDQIWLLGETDPTDVRRLVPTLPENLLIDGLGELARYLKFVTSSTAQIEDYVRLLELLPERYRVDLADLDDYERQRWNKSVRAVFNWICERIQTGLVNRGEDAPPRPENLKLLVFRGDTLDYTIADSTDLVYPNDNFLADRWKEKLAFLRINDDWRRLREWLNVPNITDVVESSWNWEGELTIETRKLQTSFERARPFFLALIRQAQPSTYERTILPRLQRLNMHVVKHLIVMEHIKNLPDLGPITQPEKVYLEKRDEPIERGAVRARVGDLYVTTAVLDNLDLLGDYIADYIEIARMGDSFVILINRDSDEARMRFLESKKLTQKDVEQVLNDLALGDEGLFDDNREQKKHNDELIIKAITAAEAANSEPTPFSSITSDKGKGAAIEKNNPTMLSVIHYPELLLDQAPEGVEFAVPLAIMNTENGPNKKIGVGKGGGYGSIPDKEVAAELGRRGEEWAYRIEKNRLMKLGFNPEELEELEELVWVADRIPTANHDIRSIHEDANGKQYEIYIEVKANAGTSRYIRLSRSEFELAVQQREKYWLYWIGNADNETPDKPVCYRNIAKLIAEHKIELNVDTIAMILPEESGDNEG